MRYRYHRLRNPLDPSDIYLVPVIPVALRYQGGKGLIVAALVDSGADICLFHSSVGRALGINLPAGRIDMMRSLSENPVPCYVHTVHLALKGEAGIDLEIGFLESDLLPDGGLLGQKGFFDEFDVRFQRWQDSIHIHRRRGWSKTR